MAVYNFRKIVSESYRVLLAAVMIGSVAGYMLDVYSGRIGAIILAMVPPVNGIGGNIGSVLGARLSSALHLGTVTPHLRGQRALRINLISSTSLGLIVYAFTGGLFFLSSFFLIGRTLFRSLMLSTVFFTTGMLLTSIIALTSVLSAFVSYTKGIDPDNVVIPVVTTVVDVGGVGSLLIMVNIIGV